jgi:putative oxidoreductase
MATYDNTSMAHASASGGQDLALLAGRILIGVLFAQSGFGKIFDIAGFASGLQGLPFPFALAALGAVVEFFGGLAIILGAWTRLAALALVAFTIVATLIAHRYWAMPEEAQRMQQIQFMKNLAIIGGLLAFAGVGGGRFGVDGLLRRRR